MPRKCKHCRQPLVQRKGESTVTFQRRQHCSTLCIIRELRACQPLPVMVSPSFADKLTEAQQLARETLKGRHK